MQVPLFRWIIVRDTGELTEVAAKSIAAAYGSAVAQPRSVRSPSDPRLSGLDALGQADRAEAIASIAHRGQTDKIGERYISHSARVAGTFDALDRPIEHVAGWLHAVIEHAQVSAQDLLDAGIRPEIVEIVALLTWTTDASEDEFLERIRYNDIARAVKAADLADNTSSWRTRLLDYETRRRLAEKNARARKYIGD